VATIPKIADREVKYLKVSRPHVVLLGAGASRAAFPDGDKNGLKLPLMCDLVDVLGLGRTLKRFGVSYAGRNFEEVYSDLYKQPRYEECLAEIERQIREYFGAMELPDPPTLYDHLVLSLREKDVIATFNWDPFLFQACARNCHIAQPPRLMFLHGNVAVGYCDADRTKGPIRGHCSICGTQFTPSDLLYPIEQKDYVSNPFIKSEWQGLQRALSHAYVFTIFGYSAPQSDIEAIELLKKGWGKPEARELEQVEIIDIKPEEELREAWDPFILEHHYDTENSFYDSWIARHPRRTCDAVWRQTMEVEFLEDNSIPQNFSFGEQVAWYKQLMNIERREARNR
jgi:hypothetical protein